MNANNDMHDKNMMGHMEYTCPMHPEIIQDHPGNCPKCGMTLVPKSEAMMNKTMCTCSMHPEVVQDHPGNCPKCGMTLVSVDSSEGNKSCC